VIVTFGPGEWARSYRHVVQATAGDRRRTAVAGLRIGLVAFVVVWLFGPASLRSSVPIWLPFLIALALELEFFVAARSSAAAPPRRPDRLPQVADRERYGYAEEPDDLLLVRRGRDELWIPYAGETGEELDALIEDALEQDDAGDGEPAAAAPAPPRRRPFGQLLVGLGVIAALAALVWVAESRGGWDSLDAATKTEATARFSAEAGRLVGRPVAIRCDESGDYVGAVQHSDGVAVVGGRLAYLSPERCYDLYRLALEDEVTFSQTARSIAVLAHEAWHLRGVSDEGRTECYALQSGVELGQRLGLSEDTARQMMRQQLAENALRGGSTSEYLVPPECRNGGSLDLDPSSSEFP
jgi:hypothetical protein